MPADPIVFDLLDDQRLASVKKEWYAKGHIWTAEDVRREVLILSQRMTHLQIAIEELCNETVSLTSLSESACLQLRGGRTKSWHVQRVEPAELPSFVDERRKLYKKVVIAADNPRKWKLETAR